MGRDIFYLLYISLETLASAHVCYIKIHAEMTEILQVMIAVFIFTGAHAF